jgi:hypothetical protein
MSCQNCCPAPCQPITCVPVCGNDPFFCFRNPLNNPKNAALAYLIYKKIRGTSPEKNQSAKKFPSAKSINLAKPITSSKSINLTKTITSSKSINLTKPITSSKSIPQNKKTEESLNEKLSQQPSESNVLSAIPPKENSSDFSEENLFDEIHKSLLSKIFVPTDKDNISEGSIHTSEMNTFTDTASNDWASTYGTNSNSKEPNSSIDTTYHETNTFSGDSDNSFVTSSKTGSLFGESNTKTDSVTYNTESPSDKINTNI